MLYAVGDIHGEAGLLRELLGLLPRQPGDRFVFMGDYVDRGPDSRGVVDTLIEFARQQECVFLLGNHESMFLDFLGWQHPAPISPATPSGSSTVYTNPTPLDGTLLDLGTLDVMKGPQGTLYGSSAMGGILKFNTREASLTDWTGSLSADLSSTEGGGLNQLYRVNANGPIATDTLGLSFTAFWKDKSGYIDNVTIPKNDWDDYEYYGGSGRLRWLATEKLEITVQGLYQKSTQDGLATIQANHGQDALLLGKGPAEPWYGEYETGETAINPSEYEAEVLGLTVDYDFGFAELTSVTSLQEMTFVQTADLTVQVQPGAQAQAHAQRLEHHGHQARREHHAQQRVAVARAGRDRGRPVARVHVARRDKVAGAGEGEHLARARRVCRHPHRTVDLGEAGRGNGRQLRAHRSSTSFRVLLPEQQIIIVRFASRSALDSTRSRWSGVPSITRVSQVPQTPSRQEYGASNPFSISVSMMVLPLATSNDRRERASTSRQFFEACESGRGWSACKAWCTPDATFAAQAEPLAEAKTLAQYTDWMKGVLSFTAVFKGTHTGEGGPCPPTGRQVESDDVYVMSFDVDRIRHMQKIWHSGLAMKELGWT